MKKKIVIWGHLPDTHTHSYIHLGFAKAFGHLDYDVIWYDDSPEYSEEDISNSIVISEINCCRYMPINKTSKYFIHNIVDGFENQNKFEGENIHNLLVYHKNYNWNDNIIDNGDYSWFDSKTKTLVLMWATDLLPNEIDLTSEILLDNDKKYINYIGTLGSEYSKDFINIVNSNHKLFKNYGGYTGEKSLDTSLGFMSGNNLIKLTQDSYLNFDIRPQCHIENGYIPCRIFKTMSYGCWIGTNSVKIDNFFEGRITTHSDLKTLYFKTEEDSQKATIEILKDNKNFIKQNHTYVNRVKSILSVLE
jgi:hypothetical protein